MDILKGLKRAWDFLWKDDSAWSLLANVIVAFLLIKFLVYPLLSLGFGTTHPIVAVVSGSMEHNGLDFDEWWNDPDGCCKSGVCVPRSQTYEGYNLTEEQFLSSKFKSGFNKGDLMFLYGPSRYDVGDVLVFRTSSLSEPIIHRVIKVEEFSGQQLLTTKGDNNCGVSPFEKRIAPDRFIGKAFLRVPYLGWIKIGFVEFLNTVRGVVQ